VVKRGKAAASSTGTNAAMAKTASADSSGIHAMIYQMPVSGAADDNRKTPHRTYCSNTASLLSFNCLIHILHVLLSQLFRMPIPL